MLESCGPNLMEKRIHKGLINTNRAPLGYVSMAYIRGLFGFFLGVVFFWICFLI